MALTKRVGLRALNTKIQKKIQKGSQACQLVRRQQQAGHASNLKLSVVKSPDQRKIILVSKLWLFLYALHYSSWRSDS